MNQQKIAVVTGASRGIGKEVAITLAKNGYHTILLARNVELLANLTNELTSSGYSAEYYVLNVSARKSVENTFTKILLKHNQIDVLFNNAGIFRGGTSTTPHSELEEMIQTNVIGAIQISNIVAEQMKKQNSGYIINLASMSGKRSMAGSGSYSASKFALMGYADGLIKEMSQYNVKVTSICPSLVATDMIYKDLNLTIDRELVIQNEDISKTVLYLLGLSKNAVPPEIQIQCLYSIAKEVELLKNRNK